MPFGKWRIQIGLLLRDAMFVNGILFNSEAWYAIKPKHMDELEQIDQTLMRFIIGAQSKVPSEMLYIETATIPLKHVISIRQMLYFQSLVARADDELIKKVYEAQKTNPVKGDWILQLKEDFQFINEEINEKEALEMSKYEYKSMIKKKVKKGL